MIDPSIYESDTGVVDDDDGFGAVCYDVEDKSVREIICESKLMNGNGGRRETNHEDRLDPHLQLQMH